MKIFISITAITVSLLFYVTGLQGQRNNPGQTKLNQVELFKQFVGNWHRNVSKDSILVWEIQQYNKAIVSSGFWDVNGKKSFYLTENLGYSSKGNNFRGINIYEGGGIETFFFTLLQRIEGLQNG